ncbi:MAG: hypothetical protein JOY62_18680 [Acidobacteriaceae bacterium]|nr:hypothetical protein [Acidobacteriaceae bacterium]MBV9781994.1 hypothetical protein [Acidobacteriaceae bacterium]
MATYISSNANRFYVAEETAYGQAATIDATNRFPAARLQAQQLMQPGKRLDKTGTRTFLGTSRNARRDTAFQVRTYLTSWTGAGQPSYGPLFHSALGASPQMNSGLLVASMETATQLKTATPHGLAFGEAVSFSNEIRFVTSVSDPVTITVTAPFSSTPNQNAMLAPAITYGLSTALPSVTLYDYWDPLSAVSRIVTGAAANSLDIAVNGDYHQFMFDGPAADLIDSSSFNPGMGGLSSFPEEPALSTFDYSIVPGHLGEVWLGSPVNQVFTLTSATIGVNNQIEVRNKEFGTSYPRALAPGARIVNCDFTLLAQSDAQTSALYAAAKLRNSISALLQLGQQQGQLMGIFLPNVVPEIPNYNDSETRLLWEFKNNRAQGTSDDEISIAFA